MATTEIGTGIDTDRLGAEYRALSETCGLIDRSERGKLALSGTQAKEFLAGQSTNDIEALTPGVGCYAAFLTHKGKMLGDMRVLDLAGDLPDLARDLPATATAIPGTETPPTEQLGEVLLLDTERATLQALFDMIRRFKIGYDVQLHKRTMQRGLLSLIGPDAARIAGAKDLPDAEHANTRMDIDGIAAIAARSDVGVDLICDSAQTDRLTSILHERGAVPVSEEAVEIVRVEHGRPRYGVDLDDSVIPQEAGLNERAVSFTKGCYVGQETVARLYYKGHPNRHLRGLRLSAPASRGTELSLGERVVGRLSSVVLSPTHGPIGLALVRREAEPGAVLSIAYNDVQATVVELPFEP